MKLHKEKIDVLIKQQGLSQNQLARLINVWPGSFSNALSGRKLLSGLLKVFPQETVSSLTINDRK